jgi:hypothetical protein
VVPTAGAEAGDHRGAKALRDGDAAFPNGVCGKAVAGARYIRQKQALDAIFAFCA